MDKPGNLSKAEREMIVVATSSLNQRRRASKNDGKYACLSACAGPATRSPRPWSPTPVGGTHCDGRPRVRRPRRPQRRPQPRSPAHQLASDQRDRLANEVLKPTVAHLCNDISNRRHALTFRPSWCLLLERLLAEPTSMSASVVGTTSSARDTTSTGTTLWCGLARQRHRPATAPGSPAGRSLVRVVGRGSHG